MTDALRVVLSVPDVEPVSGGPAENVPRLAHALADQGLEVELHTIGRDVAWPAGARARLRAAAPAWPRRLGRSPQLAAALRAARADVVHAHCLWMLPLRYAQRAAQARRVPFVISPRGMLAPWSLARSGLKKWLARRWVHPRAFESADGWHATSEAEAGDIRRLGFQQPICVAPNGIEAPSFDAAAVRQEYLQRAPQAAGRRVLLFYSRFHSKKRVLELLADFAAVADRAQGWHLLLVGIPEEYDVARVQAEVRRHGLQGRATVLDGRGAPKPYPVAELFVLPTHNENFGRVVAEALACGVPVVTTTGTPWQALNEVGAGRCVPVEGVGAALQEMLGRTPDELRQAGEAGRRWVLETFDWPRIAAQLAAFYRELRATQRRAGTA